MRTLVRSQGSRSSALLVATGLLLGVVSSVWGEGPPLAANSGAVAHPLDAIPPPSTLVPDTRPDTVKAVMGALGDLPVPDDNPMTQAKVELGKRLFQDTRLSGDSTLSCQSCHNPDHGYSASTALGPAFTSQQAARNTPSLINVAFTLPLGWDGRGGALDRQVLGPINNIVQLSHHSDLLAEQLRGDDSYRQAFRRAFADDTPTPLRIGQALASFLRTLVFDDSPLDRYMAGRPDALDEPQKRGLTLFLGKANCMACHRGPALTDNQFHNLGVADGHVTGNPAAMATIRFDAHQLGLKDWADLKTDPGRELVTKEAGDRGRFRTPSLRNVEHSAPYMHNGALTRLEDVVAFYNRGGGEALGKSRLLQPLNLSEEEQQDLVAFLTALTGHQRNLDLPKD